MRRERFSVYSLPSYAILLLSSTPSHEPDSSVSSLPSNIKNYLIFTSDVTVHFISVSLYLCLYFCLIIEFTQASTLSIITGTDSFDGSRRLLTSPLLENKWFVNRKTCQNSLCLKLFASEVSFFVKLYRYLWLMPWVLIIEQQIPLQFMALRA